MAERFKAPVLKTDVRDERTMGSNPIPSAQHLAMIADFRAYLDHVVHNARNLM